MRSGPPTTRLWRGAIALAVALVALSLGATPAAARSWRIADYALDARVERDGTAHLNERITFVFVGSFRGVYRTIPTEYPGPSGTNYSLLLRNFTVSDDAGNPLRFESEQEGDYRKLTIYIPGAVDTSKTVVIGYDVLNGLRFFPDHDEFYWNITGNDWPVPIDHVSARIQFPAGAIGAILGAKAFTGTYGAKESDATTNVDGRDVTVETNNPLPIRSGVTVDVALEKGIVKPPGAWTKFAWFLRSNPVVVLPFFAFAVMFLLWRREGKDPDPGMSVAPMYEPPAQMTPAECGALVDDSVDPRDITCTLVDLAVRGYLKIEHVKGEGWFGRDDYKFHLLKPLAEAQTLADHERILLEKMFGIGGQEVTLSSLRNTFYTAIPMIKDGIKSALKRKGMYRVDPDAAHWYNLLGVVIIAAPFVALHVLGVIQLFDSLWLAIVAGAVTLLIVFLFGRRMAATSLRGARTRVAILGFEEFMNRVDADRLKRMPPDTFEKFLPYAMALGVEHRWAQAFQGIIQNPPSWYAGPGYGPGFNTILFTNSLTSMSSTASQVFVSAPRSSSGGSGWSSGGGFSGGFSGGGFGGGGGGAF